MKNKYKDIKIGNKLKEARLACNFTQEQVSEKLDCATRYISQLETNQSIGSISVILALCSLYGITTNDLYSDYLTVDSTLNTPTIFGYYNLNSEHRRIVDNNIKFLNELQNEKNSDLKGIEK